MQLGDIRAGAVDLVDLLKINALMDAQEAAQERAAKIKTGKT
ncbi:hypothetical protein [Cupriavidus sp. DB3]|nr:hypothetical protein [Cupriavidus sp. DB3]